MTTAIYADDAFPSQFLSWLSIVAIGTTVCLFLTGLEICWRIWVCFLFIIFELYKTRFIAGSFGTKQTAHVEATPYF